MCLNVGISDFEKRRGAHARASGRVMVLLVKSSRSEACLETTLEHWVHNILAKTPAVQQINPVSRASPLVTASFPDNLRHDRAMTGQPRREARFGTAGTLPFLVNRSIHTLGGVVHTLSISEVFRNPGHDRGLQTKQ